MPSRLSRTATDWIGWFGLARGAGRPVDPQCKLPAGVDAAMTEEVEGRLRASQVNAILRLRPALMAVNIVNALLLLTVLHVEGRATGPASIWIAAVVLLAAWSLHKAWRTRSRRIPERTTARTIRRLVRSAALFGAVWAVPGLVIVPALDGFSLGFSMALLTGMIAGSAYALYPVPSAALAFMAPVTLGSIVGLALGHGWLAAAPALLASMFLLIFTVGVRRHSDLFVAEFLTRLELERRTRLIEDLLEDTRLELLGSRSLQERRLAEAKKLEAIGLLASGIAHDFNNLLTAVRGNAELLLLDERTEVALARTIIEASDRGARQISRLLSVAQKQALQPEAVALTTLLEDLRRILAPTLGTAHRLEIGIEDGTRAPFVDAAQLENSLVNLVFNARDAMSKGGVIRIDCRNAAPPVRPDNACAGIVISVLDTGCGMDADTCARATDPFFSTKGVGKGSGLGLSCVAGFARQSGGDLDILSTPGIGTTVSLVLPTSTAGDRNGAVPADVRSLPCRHRVLLVEDTDDVRTFTARALRHLGYEVEDVATDGEALAWLSAGNSVDLLLTDILLSGPTTGLQLARAVRGRRPDLAVAFMSAWTGGQIGAELGSSPLLHKPFSTAELSAHVEHALASRQSARSS